MYCISIEIAKVNFKIKLCYTYVSVISCMYIDCAHISAPKPAQDQRDFQLKCMNSIEKRRKHYRNLKITRAMYRYYAVVHYGNCRFSMRRHQTVSNSSKPSSDHRIISVYTENQFQIFNKFVIKSYVAYVMFGWTFIKYAHMCW